MIDDRIDNADGLCAFLTVLGCVTAAAYGGTQGITLAAGFHPDMVFIDLEMPGMGGCEVVRHLRASPQGSARLVCLTGRGQPADRSICLDAGFDDFFTKPIAPQCVVGVVASARAELARVALADRPP